MELIDRYVTEVGRRLPLLKGRKDIEKELRSTLEDMLEDRAQKTGRPADESLEADLLRDYGDPDNVAQSYNPMPYLVGPRMFPFFMMVLKIVITVLSIVLLVMLGIQIAAQSPMSGLEFFGVVGKGLLGIISGAISAFGNIVLVFAILERVLPASEFKTAEEKEWDPASLMKELEPDDVKPWEPIIAIVLTFIALSIFNFNPQLIGLYSFDGQEWTVIPLLTEVFFRWMPLINISWIAEIVLNSLLFRTGRWQTWTRWFSVAIKVMQILIGYFLLSGPSILALTPDSLQATGIFTVETSQILGEMAQQGVSALIGLIMFLEGIDVVKTIYKLMTRRKSDTA